MIINHRFIYLEKIIQDLFIDDRGFTKFVQGVCDLPAQISQHHPDYDQALKYRNS